jgi:hypothetical protein
MMADRHAQVEVFPVVVAPDPVVDFLVVAAAAAPDPAADVHVSDKNSLQ